MKKYSKILCTCFFAFALMVTGGCKKFVEIPLPINQLVSESAFGDDKSAIATLNGIYSKMMSANLSLCSSALSLYPGMSADELYYYTSTSRDGFMQNTLTQNNDTELAGYQWTPAYNFIYAANNCIEGANASTTLSANTKNTVIGEALFVRAFCYFNLINLFGDVPLVLTSDYDVNKNMARTATGQIYTQITTDLLQAEQLLSDSYPSTGRARPNKATVRALLAKVYLFQKDWANVIKMCDPILQDARYTLPTDLTTVFLSSSTEAIWQLAPVTPTYNTYVGNIIIPASSTAAPTYLITDYLRNAFESGDKRLTSWVQSRSYQSKTLYYPFKYKIKTGTTVTEYNMVFRLAEVLLMRAEAKAQLYDLDGARTDVGRIRARAGLGGLSASINQADLLSAILKERRIELFSEWGNRWFDLKRTNTVSAILATIKPFWKASATLYPIPYSQLVVNPALVQNEGY